jgi:hypothetical protein
MYQTMIDPVEEFDGNISQLCESLLTRAREDRESLRSLSEREEGWQDAKQRLPKVGEWAIVVIGGVVQRQAARRFQDFWEWLDEEADSCPLTVVTHWMSLPAGPVQSRTAEKK